MAENGSGRRYKYSSNFKYFSTNARFWKASVRKGKHGLRMVEVNITRSQNLTGQFRINMHIKQSNKQTRRSATIWGIYLREYFGILTLHAKRYALANSGRNVVRSDAQVCSHVQSTYLHDVQHLAIHDIHYNTNRTIFIRVSSV